MKALVRLSASLLASALLISLTAQAQRTTTRFDETNNNTSACAVQSASYVDPSAPRCLANFLGAKDDGSAGSDNNNFCTQAGCNPTLNQVVDTVTFDAAPANLGDFAHDGVDIHNLVFPGYTGQVFANILLWHEEPTSGNFGYTPKQPGPENTINGHFLVGYISNKSEQVTAQLNHMQRLKLDGIVGNPPGPLPTTMTSLNPDNVNTNAAMEKWKTQIEGSTTPFLFSVMTDQVMWNQTCPPEPQQKDAQGNFLNLPACVEKIMICSLDYMNTPVTSTFTCVFDGVTYSGGGYFGDSRYWKVGGRPVVSYFLDASKYFQSSVCTASAPCSVYNDNQAGTTCTSSNDCWTKIWHGIDHHLSNTTLFPAATRPALIHRNFGAPDRPNDGTFRWFNASQDQTYLNFGADPNTSNSVDTLGYDGWLSTLSGTSPNVVLALGYGKVDHAQSPFEIGDHKIMDARCGRTLLDSMARPAQLLQSRAQQAVELGTWDDYDEGTEVETGIDNCVGSLTESLTGSTLSWSITFGSPGTEDTIDHYSVFYSTDQLVGESLTWLTDVQKNSANNGHYTATLPSTLPSTTVVYVKAVGKALITNHMVPKSGSIIFTPGTSHTVSFANPLVLDADFQDSNGWNQAQYGTTMMFADLNGDGKMDVCARGVAGIWCALSTGTGFGTASIAVGQFRDDQGWNQVPYYGSIRLADVNGDGKPDVCGRGLAGVACFLGNGDGTFGPAQVSETSFSDANGLNQAQYGTTLMFADLNGDGKADVCVRRADGIWCELSTGTGFGTAFLAVGQFRDDQQWNQVQYYGSLRLADVNGDGKPDICGRGLAGVACFLGNGDGTFGPAQVSETSFSDANSWNQAQYGTTIMFADLNGDGKMDVCGRGPSGIICELSTGTGFGPQFLAVGQFRDDQGWNQIPYYGSIRLADVSGDGRPEVCGRGIAGLQCGAWQLN